MIITENISVKKPQHTFKLVYLFLCSIFWHVYVCFVRLYCIAKFHLSRGCSFMKLKFWLFLIPHSECEIPLKKA